MNEAAGSARSASVPRLEVREKVTVAALFATTIVYGRLSADNELTALIEQGEQEGCVELSDVTRVAETLYAHRRKRRQLGIFLLTLPLQLLLFATWAAGELVGGIFYHNYPGGTGLTSGSVFGKIAGESAGKYSKAA